MAYHEVCSCKRIFTTPGAMKNHQNVCTVNKKHLSSALANAKELLAVQKAKRLEALAIRKKAQECLDGGSVQSTTSTVTSLLLSTSAGHGTSSEPVRCVV